MVNIGDVFILKYDEKYKKNPCLKASVNHMKKVENKL